MSAAVRAPRGCAAVEEMGEFRRGQAEAAVGERIPGAVGRGRGLAERVDAARGAVPEDACGDEERRTCGDGGCDEGPCRRVLPPGGEDGGEGDRPCRRVEGAGGPHRGDGDGHGKRGGDERGLGDVQGQERRDGSEDIARDHAEGLGERAVRDDEDQEGRSAEGGDEGEAGQLSAARRPEREVAGDEAQGRAEGGARHLGHMRGGHDGAEHAEEAGHSRGAFGWCA